MASDRRVVRIDGRDRRPWALKTRELILKAAVEEIAERGFDRARLVDIAKRADVTVGSIYTWYRDKADLFTAALDLAVEEQRSQNENALASLPNRDDGHWLWKIAVMVPRGTSGEAPSAAQRLLIEAMYAAWQNEEARATILPRLQSLLLQYQAVVLEAQRDGHIAAEFDAELIAFILMALPIGLSALDLAGLSRPDAHHWLAVYQAFGLALEKGV